MSTDRNLMACVLAHQMDFVTAERLVAGMNAWAAEKATPLLDVLRQRGDLNAVEADAVERRLAEDDPDTRKGQSAGSSTEHTMGGRPRSPEPFPPLPSAGGSRYRRLREHAKGGLGEVSVAMDEELRREVALKEIQGQYADHPAMRERFIREAEITGQLEHPGVVPVYGLGLDALGRPYYAMRFIAGESLEAAIARGAERRGLLTRFVAVCNAVAFAHSRGVIHRDLKPANVMLGEFGETLVVDWGLARRVGEGERPAARPLVLSPAYDATAEGAAVGTPAYMPPEQARGRLDEVGPHSDVWALGAMLYAILSGKPPYDGRQALLDAAACEPRPAAGAVPALDAVCRKAMAREPKGRYSGAKELAAEVERWLADEPVTAYRDPLSVRALRWAKKRRTLVTSLVVLLVGGTVALAVGLGLVRAEQRRTAANLALAKRAVDECFNVAKDDPLFQGGGMLPAKKLLLARALPFYRDFRSRGGSDGLYAEEADQALRVGYITQQVGQNEEALAAYRRARDVYERLTDAHPDVPEYRAGVAGAQNSAGTVLAGLRQRDEALVAFRMAAAAYQQLADAHPDVPEYRRGLAATHTNAGNVLAGSGQRDEALASHDRAAAILQPLADAYADVPAYQSDLADTHTNTGVLLAMSGQFDQALAAFGKAAVLRQRLADAHPDVPEYQAGRAATHSNTGRLLAGLRRRDEALAAFETAAAVLQRLADAHPAVPEYRSDLADTHTNTGNVLLGAGRGDEALAAFGRAAAIFQRLADVRADVPEYQRGLAGAQNNTGIVLAELGRRGEALAAFGRAAAVRSRLADAYPDVPQLRTDLALTHSNVAALFARDVGRLAKLAAPPESLRQQEIDKLTREVLHHLRRSQEYGYFANPAYRAHFAKNPVFAAVRDRADFKAFVATLPKP